MSRAGDSTPEYVNSDSEENGNSEEEEVPLPDDVAEVPTAQIWLSVAATPPIPAPSPN